MQERISQPWSKIQKRMFRFGFLWVLMLVVSLPFPHLGLPDLGSFLSPITVGITEAIAQMLGLGEPRLQEISSDTLLMYVHVGLVTVLAVVGSVVWGSVDGRRKDYVRLWWGLRTIGRYYVAAFLLIYGFSKVFKWQFYLPEPNTLFTPLGEVPRDLLFWSTMGASRGYSVFTGCLEVVAGGLLLFRRSSLAGGLLGFAVMANVVVLNFCYDISVKVFSSFLLLLCGMLLVPDARRFWQFLIGRAVEAREVWRPDFHLGRWRWAYPLVKCVVIGLIVWDAVGVYVQAGNFNDDSAPRPMGHGAYAVEDFVVNGDTLPPDLRMTQRWRRVFVHRQGYFITQGMDDAQQDYRLRTDSVRHLWVVGDLVSGDSTVFSYTVGPEHVLHLRGLWGNDTLALRLRALDWRAMPLLRGDFNWTSDSLQ